MDGKAVFTQECHGEAFKGLCINVLPLVGKILNHIKKSGVEGMASVLMDTNGYFSFSIHNSPWEMVKLDNDSPARIEYRYSEVVSIPENLMEGAGFGHLTENIMEITLVYADLRKKDPELCKIDSTTWKQLFVDWANEFESRWQEDVGRDYLEEIGSFTRERIQGYLKSCNGERKAGHVGTK